MMALADGVEASAALGRLEVGDEHLGTLEDEAEWPPLGQARAQRSASLLLLARGDAVGALAAADEAAAGFEAAGYTLHHGRALLVAGDALCRLGERRRAAEKLEAAKAIFDDLGARLWLTRVEEELRRARPRPRRDRELTNVAAQLFITVATVEAHLTRIYRKLSVRSRTELTRRVADGTVSLADED
jgi:tetratricopeptide (TPR) repeat protein